MPPTGIRRPCCAPSSARLKHLRPLVPVVRPQVRLGLIVEPLGGLEHAYRYIHGGRRGLVGEVAATGEVAGEQERS